MKNIGKDKLFWFGFSFILLVSIFLRFFNYSNRWWLWVDQAGFALLSRYALFNHQLPLWGPFSSAGPFQTGGEWYWLIMLLQAFYPWSLITPWVGITIIYVIFVGLIMLVAKELGGRVLGITVGILAAISTSQIAQSINLTNQSPLPIISLLALWFAIKYLKKRSNVYLFLLSLLAGLAPTIHAQGFMLVPLVFIAIIFSGIPNIKKILIVIIGLFLPWLPIFIADSYNHFSNTYHLFQYYLHDQYQISLDVLGRRWLTYAGTFWPQAWSHIIGGNIILGYVILSLLVIFGALGVYKSKISKEWYLIVFSFLVMVIMIRYARVPLYDSNLMVTHPFVLLLTGWITLNLFKINRVIGVLFLCVVAAFSMVNNFQLISTSNNISKTVEKNRDVLIRRYPNTKFVIYDHKFRSPGITEPLTLYLDEQGRIDDNGRKIGVSIATFSAKLKLPVIYKTKDDPIRYFWDLSSLSKSQLLQYGWESINPSAIYHNVQEWYKDKK